MRRPHVLYFVCHDLGRALGCYGADIPTPHLDAFARQGLRFTDAHCASPACSPSRACAMSGLHPHQSGALGLSHMGWPLPLTVQTTVDDFNAAGYQTILSGLNHERHPRTDRYQLDLSRHWEDWKLPRAIDNALAALRNRDPSRPFYLNLATQEPHACTWKDVSDGERTFLSVPSAPPASPPPGRIPALPDHLPTWLPPGMPRTPALEAAFRRFAACVVFLDAQFGRLLHGLDQLGLSDDTLVVFTTDHGMSGPRGKGSLLALGTEIALLMRQPGVLPADQSRAFPVSNLSFRATLADAARIQTTTTPTGRSFWPAALDPAAAPPPDEALLLTRNFHGEKPWRTETDYLDCHDPTRALRTASHLYLRRFAPTAKPPEPLPGVLPSGPQTWDNWGTSWALPTTPRPAEELYDLTTDPLELHNVAATPAYASVLATLRARLANAMLETHDHLPFPPPPRPEPPGWGPTWPAQ